jgi:hypothetical protein
MPNNSGLMKKNLPLINKYGGAEFWFEASMQFLEGDWKSN